MSPSDAIRHARVLIDNGDKKRAAKLLNRVLEARPRTIEAWALMSTIVTADADKIRCAERIAALSTQSEVVFGSDEVPKPADVSEGGGLHAPAKKARPSKKEAQAAEAALSNLPSAPVLVAIVMGVVATGVAGFSVYAVTQLTKETKVVKGGFEADSGPGDATDSGDAAAQEDGDKSAAVDPAVVSRIDELELKVQRLTAELDNLAKKVGDSPAPGASPLPRDDDASLSFAPAEGDSAGRVASLGR